jgi:hypothetical protein
MINLWKTTKYMGFGFKQQSISTLFHQKVYIMNLLKDIGGLQSTHTFYLKSLKLQ